MLPKDSQNKHALLNAFCSSLLIVFVLYALPAYSQQTPWGSISAVTILENVVKQVPQLMQLVTAIAYVAGMYFVFIGLLRMKHLGESRTMMSSEHGLKEPLIYLAVGAMLLYLPTTIQVGLTTFWTEPNPYGYLQEKDQWAELYNAFYIIIQFIGVIAFIRGLLIFTQLAKQGGQPGLFGKGLTHIIGGIFCINIYQFVQVVMATFFGISS